MSVLIHKTYSEVSGKIRVLPKMLGFTLDLLWNETYLPQTWKISWERSSILPTLLKVALMLEYLRFRPVGYPAILKRPVICQAHQPPPSGSQQCRHPTKGWALVEGDKRPFCVLTSHFRAQEKKNDSPKVMKFKFNQMKNRDVILKLHQFSCFKPGSTSLPFAGWIPFRQETFPWTAPARTRVHCRRRHRQFLLQLPWFSCHPADEVLALKTNKTMENPHFQWEIQPQMLGFSLSCSWVPFLAADELFWCMLLCKKKSTSPAKPFPSFPQQNTPTNHQVDISLTSHPAI